MPASPEMLIRLATVADACRVGALLDAMDRHYRPDMPSRAPDEAAALVSRTIENGEGTRFVLALGGGEPVGLACYAILRPGRDLAGIMFVKDLFVPAERRSARIGEALLRWLAAKAITDGIGRIDLYTGTENTGAQAFYRRLGGIEEPSVKYRYEAEGLRRLADLGQ